MGARFYIYLMLVVSYCAEGYLLPSIYYRSLYNMDSFHSIQNLNAIKMKSYSCTRLYQIMNRNYIAGKTGDRELVLDDFNQIVEAIEIFQQVYGDCRIPLKFEVPAEKEWPSMLHGLRLGRRLQKLQGSSDFVNNHPEKVKELTRVGWNPNKMKLTDDWTVLFESMQVYQQLNGDLRIPSKFVVPEEEPWPRLAHGLKLGVRVAAIRSAGRYVKDHPERKAELDKIGFEWRLRDHTHKQQVEEDRFDQVYQALVWYKKLVNDKLSIPATYVVPSTEEWPSELHGLRLGNQVYGIRVDKKLVFGHPDRIQALTEIGFQWGDTSRSMDTNRRFELIYESLKMYKSLYGDLVVPQSFVVPAEEPWPESTWGIKLGSRASAIRSQSTFVSNSPERRAMLDALGFNWELPSETRRRLKLEQKRLKELEESEGGSGDASSTSGAAVAAGAGGMSMASSGVGAEGELSNEYDAEMARALGLVDGTGAGIDGITATDSSVSDASSSESSDADVVDAATATAATARRIRNRSAPGRIAGVARSVLLYDPSLIFEPVAYREIAAEAVKEHMLARELSSDPNVRQFSHFEGHLTPQAFNNVITRAILPEDIEAMKKISYRILEFGKFNWDDVIEALEMYKTHFGDIDVPHEFVINENVLDDPSLSFDERFEDMQLGEAVAGLRCGDIDGLEDPTRRKVLDALGFDWGDKSKYQRYRFVPMFLGLKVYKHLYGFPMPQCDFVVPDAPQWPYWMANMPLGEWTAIARIQQQMIFEHYPHRQDMLNALEFLWWVPPGPTVPTKYFRSVK